VFRDSTENMLGDCPDDAWMIVVGRGCWSIRDFPFDTWGRGIVDALSVDDHIDFSMMSDFKVGMHLMGMILDGGCDPLRHYNMWMQSGHDGQTTMIIVAQHQRGGSFLRIAWDLGISVGDSAVVDTEASARFCLHEIGSLAKQFLGGLIKLLQHQVALLTGSFQETSDVSTLSDHVLSGGCFTSYRVVWENGIIFSFSQWSIGS
jgi:hypothetical protein